MHPIPYSNTGKRWIFHTPARWIFKTLPGLFSGFTLHHEAAGTQDFKR